MAMDFVINWMIMEAYGKDGFVEMPENISYGDGQYFQKCCYDPQFAGWDTAKVFWKLHKKSGGDDGDGPGKIKTVRANIIICALRPAPRPVLTTSRQAEVNPKAAW